MDIAANLIKRRLKIVEEKKRNTTRKVFPFIIKAFYFGLIFSTTCIVVPLPISDLNTFMVPL
jgi:hypothetical protein